MGTLEPYTTYDFVVCDNAERPHVKVVFGDAGENTLAEIYIGSHTIRDCTHIAELIVAECNYIARLILT